jgi:hypothetical protein
MPGKKTRTYVNMSCAGVCAVLIGLSGASPMRAEGPKLQILFIQQDKVTTFNPANGTGVESGTATGAINGVSLTNFYFTTTSTSGVAPCSTPTSSPCFTFNDHVGITDIDGDQIIFENIGTGKFIFPGLFDPTKGVPTQVLQSALGPQGGPLTGTYTVVATSGKYVKTYPLGLVLQYRAIAMNPNQGDTGSTYVEVYAPSLFFFFGY